MPPESLSRSSPGSEQVPGRRRGTAQRRSGNSETGSEVPSPGQQPWPPDGFAVVFDGTPLPVQQGQTVAAVLLAAGIRSWRTTRQAGRPRGLFCGIGVCFDCLVVLNGVPNVRACLAEARPGDVINSQEGTGHVG